MKKIVIIILMLCLLAGCSDAATFETLGNIPQQPSTEPVRQQVVLELPEEAAEDVFSGEEETLYVCQDYTISLKTLSSGDLSGSIQGICGYEKEKLTVLESSVGELARYDWVWTSAGEAGDLVGRAAILDDGNYHYCLTVLAPAEESGELAKQWNALFRSFRLET